jgi:hypothetical protein
MRYFTSALCTAVGVGLLAACAGNMSGQSGSVPGLMSPSRVERANNRTPISLVAGWMHATGIQRLHLGMAFPDKKKKPAGVLYASEFYSNLSEAEGRITKSDHKTRPADLHDQRLCNKRLGRRSPAEPDPSGGKRRKLGTINQCLCRSKAMRKASRIDR